jgi:hypothetical protein
MHRLVVAAVAALSIAAAGCGATTRSTTTSVQNPALPTLTSATVNFVSRDHGKDKDSGLTVQLMKNNAELVGEINATGIKFDDHSSSGPFVVSLNGGPFSKSEIDTGQVRVRLVPDGRDDWTFDLYMTMRFGDNSTQHFAWRGVRLDNTNLERVLALAPARTS